MLGYRGRIAVVDLTAERVDTSGIPDSVFFSFIGGRGLGATPRCPAAWPTCAR